MINLSLNNVKKKIVYFFLLSGLLIYDLYYVLHLNKICVYIIIIKYIKNLLNII